MKIAFVEWPENLTPGTTQWDRVRDSVTAAGPDILVTNELPFGPWLAEAAAFSKVDADHSIRAHQQGIEALIDLKLAAIISSRPVCKGNRLANEAFVLEKGMARPLHRNIIFPTNQDGSKASGTPAKVRVLMWQRFWESGSVCFCARKLCSTNAHGLTGGKRRR